MKNKLGLYLVLFFMALMMGTVAYGALYTKPRARQILLKYGKYTVATVTDLHYHTGRGGSYYVPDYTFRFRGHTYSGKGCGYIQMNSKSLIQETDRGLRYYLVFLPENPDLNCLLPYELYQDSTGKQLIPEEGWERSDLFGPEGVRFQIRDPIRYY